MNVKINSHITANLYYSIVALFYMRHASPVAEVLEELIFAVYHVLYYALNLLYFCTSVKNKLIAFIRQYIAFVPDF